MCEASRVDRRWGIGYNAGEAMKYQDDWGENLLGKALMRVRECIKVRLKDVDQGVRVKGDWDLPSE